jgi:O-antigen ligase
MKWSAAHNSFIEIGAELGVIGLTLFIMALYQAWQMLRSIGSSDARAGPLGPLGHALAGVLISYCVAGFFLAAAYSAYMYTIFAMVLGVAKILAYHQAPAPAPQTAGPPPLAVAGTTAAWRPWPSRPRPRASRYPGPAPLPPRLPPA